MNEEILIPIFFFGATAAILWKFFDARHKERMTILEKGLVSEDLKHLYSGFTWKANPFTALKYGMLAAFIGAGILVSAFVSRLVWENQEMITTGIIFLAGGSGLISFYKIAQKKMDQ
ncbi:MAG: hypothetical protein HYV29_14730 [Ignavibacteriales bacterium]|nr:hypothetical protein [Ignavibacteriales bacterium]